GEQRLGRRRAGHVDRCRQRRALGRGGHRARPQRDGERHAEREEDRAPHCPPPSGSGNGRNPPSGPIPVTREAVAKDSSQAIDPPVPPVPPVPPLPPVPRVPESPAYPTF